MIFNKRKEMIFMKFCTKCGQQLDDDSKFCTACGEPMEQTKRADFGETVVLNTNMNSNIAQENKVPPAAQPTPQPEPTPQYIPNPNPVQQPQPSANYASNGYANQNGNPYAYAPVTPETYAPVHDNNLIESYKLFWQNFAKFEGRTRRRDYWQVVLCNILISAVLGLLSAIPFLGQVALAIAGIYTIAALVPGISMAIRRLHDIDKSGWFYLFILIPLVGQIILIVWFCQDSQPGQNKYGPNPKGIN